MDAQVIKRLGKFILYLERSGADLDGWLEEYERLIKKAPHPGPDTHLPGQGAWGSGRRRSGRRGPVGFELGDELAQAARLAVEVVQGIGAGLHGHGRVF